MTHKQNGYLLTFAIVVVLVTVTGLCLTGGHERLAQALSDAVDSILFKDEAHINTYKELVK